MPHKKESLGRMAVFLIPVAKLKVKNSSGETVESRTHNFLISNFNGYTADIGHIFGFWRDSLGKEFFGEHKEYKVSFVGKERISDLENFLAKLAKEMDEQCIYFETGEDSWLIYS